MAVVGSIKTGAMIHFTGDDQDDQETRRGENYIQQNGHTIPAVRIENAINQD